MVRDFILVGRVEIRQMKPLGQCFPISHVFTPFQLLVIQSEFLQKSGLSRDAQDRTGKQSRGPMPTGIMANIIEVRSKHHFAFRICFLFLLFFLKWPCFCLVSFRHSGDIQFVFKVGFTAGQENHAHHLLQFSKTRYVCYELILNACVTQH